MIPATPTTPEMGVAVTDYTGMMSAEIDEKKIVAEVRSHYTDWREQRKKHEGRWFLSGAFLRGQQHVEYNEGLAKLVQPPAPSYRVKLDLNRIRPKIRARLSKFFKTRPRPTVIPASSDYDDILNARATEKTLTFHWDRLHLEEKYKDARLWASIASKSYWWFYYDETTPARLMHQGQEHTIPLGDVCVEVSSPFEVLVADPAIPRIGDQPAIQRVRMMKKEDVEQRYPLSEQEELRAVEAKDAEKVSQYPDRLATLRAGGGAGTTDVKRGEQVLVIEEFTAPCAKYPKGRYVVVAGDRLVKLKDELPYGMWDHKANPYPVVEFTDSLTPGQYWGTTFVEQLIDVQRQYNYLFELLMENIRAVARPKIIVYKQHNLPDGAWTTAAGEIVELTYVPGLPAPIILQPANIAGDVWNLIAFYDRLFDELTQIYPAAEGAVASASSGFQTNLLQEATDTVHAPDVREDELALQEAAWKIRRICKLWYDVPRLFSILGSNSLPEVMEFSKSQIDEFAEVRIQAGSMLPDLKAAKAQTAMELHQAGLFGDPADPLVRRRVLNLLDMGGLEVVREEERKDADEAERENQLLASGADIAPPIFYQDMVAHIDRHQQFMKSPAFAELPPPVKMKFVAHLIQHYDWVNPALAVALRPQFGLMGLPPSTPPPAMPAPLGAPGAPQAAPTPGAQPAPPPSPQAPPSRPVQ